MKPNSMVHCCKLQGYFFVFFHSSKGFSNRDCLYVKQEKQVYEKTSIIILLFKTKTNEQMGQILIG